jgi:hypothetical protein
VLDAEKIDQSWSTILCLESTECRHWTRSPREKRRVSEALAHVDAQRETLTGQLGELEAAERVLARYSKSTPANKTVSARTPSTAANAATPAGSRGRPRTATAKTVSSGKRSSPSLADQVLALATGRTQQEIAAACRCG